MVHQNHPMEHQNHLMVHQNHLMVRQSHLVLDLSQVIVLLNQVMVHRLVVDLNQGIRPKNQENKNQDTKTDPPNKTRSHTSCLL